ncbi:DUF6436 domain-containing protein [Pseudomonas sp. dw_358]|uniref:DUF6436 domain-containing protein n=1 Tax=Pseudomonas sp. dw_358 TaxID=2720083 RepID=UPI001BD5DB4B|nr:DUF6436 domain-containing protein [Pseudomonas sp. dw_358]
MPRIHRRTLAASLIALLCASALWLAYDWFQSRYVRAFDQHATLFTGDNLQLPPELAGPGPIRVVHFWDATCPCNVGNQEHLAELVQQYEPKGVKFYALEKGHGRSRLPDNLSVMQRLEALPGADALPASPAVAIWNQQGQLAYFGPYSEGAVCSSANSFIEPVLQALTEHRSVNATHTLAVGCYCGWAAVR